MLFNSTKFALFLGIVFILYWFVMNKNHRSQNILLVIASFCFYALWDWRFLILMVISKSIDFISTIQIDKSNDDIRKKRFLILSIFINVGVLCFFKYFNFFTDSFSNMFSLFGYNVSSYSINIIIPVGLSFYTLQALGYVIDVYREEVKPTYSVIDYFAFISFFPLVLAGPIERASNLLYQLNKRRVFEYTNAVDGLRQILWGLFKKVVIADNCAEYANTIFNNYLDYSGSTLVLGALFFTFQIYCDFSGYSDMAIGIAKLFNINLMQNFAFPYFSRDIGEFWRRWHISLSSWLFDYIFKPLQMSLRNLKLLGNFSALFLTFIISGVWHGSNWTFIVWGILNTLYYLPNLLFVKRNTNTDIVAKGKLLPTGKELLSMGITFGLTVFAWIFFRANNLEHAMSYISEIFSGSLFIIPHFDGIESSVSIVFLTCVFMIIEWLGRDQQYAFQITANMNKYYLRIICYYVIVASILWFGNFDKNQFIYFQF